ncbi:MAG TPA: hypothetical protein VFH07_12575 [Chitinophagaceae bacterium]|nr:hypothetical protein [Chitinophagaceae bacterium]
MTSKTILVKAKAVTIPLLFLSFCSFSQTCEVDKESLKGTYTGDCKKNKAHGKGKAIGIDTYEGDFKNGLPDGQGIYTWSNKNVFEGKYVKGLREGKGIITFKRQGAQDSIVEGYWKKDAYIGPNEKPWIVYSKTGSVRNVEVEFTPDKLYRVKVIITNTTGGVTGLGGQMPQYKVDNLVLLKGSYQRQNSLETHYKSTETTYQDVLFPFRVKLQMQKEEVELEMFAEGSYIINISINN